MKKITACIDCPLEVRQSFKGNCHSECEKYLKQAEERNAYREQIHQAKVKEYILRKRK